MINTIRDTNYEVEEVVHVEDVVDGHVVYHDDKKEPSITESDSKIAAAQV